MKRIILIFTLFISWAIHAQNFEEISIQVDQGQLKGISLVDELKLTQTPPIIFIHGTGEHAGRYKSFMEGLAGDYNSWSISLSGHGNGNLESKVDKDAKLKARFERFHKVDIPEIVKYVANKTGQKPIIVGFSMGAKAIKQTLITNPHMKEKVSKFVSIGEATNLQNSSKLFEKFLKVGEKIVHLFEKYPNMPKSEKANQILAHIFPILPKKFYAHLEGTEIEHLVEFFRTGVSNKYDPHYVADLVEFALNNSYENVDHGVELWNIYASNDIFSPDADTKHYDIVQLRVMNYLRSDPNFMELTAGEQLQKKLHLFQKVIKGDFPPGFVPIYGTNLGEVGHLGAVIGGSKAANTIVAGIRIFGQSSSTQTNLPTNIRFRPENLSIINCSKKFIISAATRKLRAIHKAILKQK